MFEVEYYEMKNGKVPVREFIDGLSIKMQSKAMAGIEILEELGPELREPYSKSLAKGLFELRIKFANDICRIMYFFFSGKKIILTNGFIKKTTKTPLREIQKARKYKSDYERRMQNGKL